MQEGHQNPENEIYSDALIDQATSLGKGRNKDKKTTIDDSLHHNQQSSDMHLSLDISKN